ncbi:SDR family NAD(P)-dependent oxidoreductase [Histidinibacterium lentulum]|uniref:SDR family NAD(P)-dependent oxidoreductase n=1 Tax=Histidinibacterium lentulum TaxID=2480588 RepID=A0A3N2QS87_9RHOB|nr:SDR family NAD(P)-dependent oxidoreductase [Histidinibacterium lentulum]ROT98073.1 SDR family NAD(P)-dependent oxidoreductase [Histidinibacterium lentulum]
MPDLAIVIGAGPGLGAAITRRFAQGGCAVAPVARDAGRLEALCAEIEAAGGTARPFAADSADFDSLRAAIAGASAWAGPPAALIYNVSRFLAVGPLDLEPETLDSELRISATAALAATQAVAPAMQAAGRGTVLWTGGGTALRPQGGSGSPSLTSGKSAMRGLALASAKALHGAGINFRTITINGAIKEGTPFAPDLIAEAFWAAFDAPREAWVAEETFDGG